MLRLADIKKKPLNESSRTSTIEFIKSVSDGNTYAIVRENRTYYIKSTETKDILVESDFDYLGGLGNRTKNSFRAYDDAITRLNLIFNDINRVQDINEDVDMVNFDYILNENGEYVKVKPLQEKKFILKQPKSKKSEDPIGDFSDGEDSSSDDEFNFDGEDSSSDDEFNFDGEDSSSDDEFNKSVEGGDSIKDIQKTTGTLGQQLRDTEDLSSDMQKWVAKSVISALNLNTMDDSDKDNIINAIQNSGDKKEESTNVDFMDDNLDYSEVEYSNGRTMDRGGEPDLDNGEEIILDDDEGPGGYIGWEEDSSDAEALEMRDIDMGIQDKAYLNLNPENISQQSNYIDYMDDDTEEVVDGPIVYMTDDDMKPCGEGVNCGEEMEEGMSSWDDADNEGGMGWKTNESVSYMGDDYTEEEIDRIFDNMGISDDNYTMNEPAPTKPKTKPDTDTPAPTRPSKNPFTPPSRIRPGEEPRPKARRDVDYMDDEDVEFS